MMKQYLQIKEQNQDAILFFRLGDFYEMFGDDARKASKELDLTLTTRDKDKNKPFEEKVPMCGIPYHASDAYIARLIAKGYKVAICEQTQDPATAKGLVDRDIIRVVTPGTVIDAACLEEGRSNFCAGLYLDDTCAGFSVCDISTGKTHVTAFQGPDRAEHLLNELGRFSPAEAVVNPAAYQCGPLLSLLQDKLHCHVERLSAGRFQLQEAERTVRTQFGDEAAGRLPKGNPAAALSLGALLGYLHETQKTDLRHVDDLDYYQQGQFMELDLTARRNLELTETLRSKEKKGSLLWVLDKTKTPMGGRMLRSWLERPLLSVTAITRRNGAVGQLVDHTMVREELALALTGIGDMERLVGRIVYGTAGGRDVVSLKNAMARLPHVKELLSAFDRGRLGELAQLDTLEDLTDLIGRTLCDDPPFSVREGEFIREGFDPEVDRLRGILHGGKGIIASMEAAEKEKTGIRTLKIGYNKVFGYYIEVSNSFKDQVPETYIRKQTLVNGERYITQELKDLEHDILSASDRVSALEYELFTRLRQELSGHVARIQATAAAVAEADCLCSLAAVAVKNNYCCPAVDESGVIENSPGTPPSGGGHAARRPVCAQRHLYGPHPGPGVHHHRPQHGGQVHLYAPGGADGAHGPDRVLRPGQGGPPGHCGPGIYPHRGLRRSVGGAVHLYGGDDGGQRHPPCRHGQEPADPGRDRPGHLYLRRYEHRTGGFGILRRPQAPGGKDPVCHPLPRAYRHGGHPPRREELQHRRPGPGRGDRVPAEDRPRRRGPQLRHRGGQAGGPAGRGGVPGQKNPPAAGGGVRPPGGSPRSPGGPGVLCRRGREPGHRPAPPDPGGLADASGGIAAAV